MAGEIVAVKGGAAGAMERRLVIDNVGFEAGNRHDRFESGAWGQLRLNRAIKKRLTRIVRHLVPLLAGDAAGELVWVVAGRTDHGEYSAIARVHCHYGAALAGHGQLSYRLQVQVESGLQVFPGDGFLRRLHLALAAEVIDQYALLSIHAAQRFVVFAFEAVLADDVALVVIDELRGIQLGFPNFTDITDHVRGKSVLRILAAPGANQLHFRIGARVLVGFDPSDLVARQLILDDNLRTRGAAANHSGQVAVIELQRV